MRGKWPTKGGRVRTFIFGIVLVAVGICLDSTWGIHRIGETLTLAGFLLMVICGIVFFTGKLTGKERP